MRKAVVSLEVKEAGKKGGRVLISTPALDRDREIMLPQGAKLEAYRRNPVVFWGHQYREPWALVGRTTSIEVTDRGIEAEFEFREPTGENDPLHIVRALWDQGLLRAASVGFKPLKVVERAPEEVGLADGNVIFDESRRPVRVVAEWELMEWSLVPIPANQEALRLAAKGVVPPEAETHDDAGVSVKGVVPRNVSSELAPIGTPWRRPTLSDFTDRSWDDLSDAEKRRIAGHFAWAASMPPARFGDLKLPHHRPSDGRVVWRGVAAAMAALLGARGGVDIPDADRRAVYNHLAAHYRQFDREPPALRDYTPEEVVDLVVLAFADDVEDKADTDNEDAVETLVPLLREVAGLVKEAMTMKKEV